MGLLTHSLVHGRIGSARQKNGTHREKLFRHLFLHTHRYLERLAATDINRYPAPETDFFNHANFPDGEAEGIRIRGRFHVDPLETGEFFQRLRVTYDVQASLPRPPTVYSSRSRPICSKGESRWTKSPF